MPPKKDAKKGPKDTKGAGGAKGGKGAEADKGKTLIFEFIADVG